MPAPRNLTGSLAIAGIIRYLIIISKYATLIQNRVEISTPLNSWKRVKEGAFLYASGINPYDGDMYHENPIILVLSNALIRNCPSLVPFVFIAIDLMTAILLHQMSKRFVTSMFTKEQSEEEQKKMHPQSVQLHLSADDVSSIPIYVALAYLFNPYAIFNCVGLTTTVISNFLLATFLYALSGRNRLLSCLCLALETQRNFYPIVLIVPAMLILSDEEDAASTPAVNGLNKKRLVKSVSVFVLFLTMLGAVNGLGYGIMQNWEFLQSTYGFIFNHDDLQPNIGLFWYFFTEMFEHFRTLFLYTFQMNATVLYILPLTVKLHRQPVLLATILMALITIFRSYPCVGDVAFYMALLPLFKRSAKFMANNFVVFCFFLIASALGPTVWFLWIYCNSANANFYFGATLAFASAQIFLVTDLLFATNKREFCLYNGLDVMNKITLA